MAWKDYYSAILSSLALIVSCTTAYYNIFRVNIDAKLLVAGSEYPAYGAESGGITNVYWDESLTFINQGNRPFSVQSITLSSFNMKSLDEKLDDCEPLTFGGGVILGGFSIEAEETSFKPTVIDPGKIVILHPSFVNDPQKNPPRYTLEVVKDPPSPPSTVPLLIKSELPGGQIYLTSCIDVQLVDHEGYLHNVSKPVAFTERETVGPNEGGGSASLSDFSGSKPIDLSGVLSASQQSRSDPPDAREPTN